MAPFLREIGVSTRRLPKYIKIEDEEIRVATLLIVVGHNDLDMYETFDWGGDADITNKFEEVMKMFKSRLVLETNKPCEIYEFFKRNQKQRETTNS